MKDREICEKIIENDAFRSEMGLVCDNFLCPECQFNDCDCGADNDTIIELAKKWLADHPEDNGWKPLEVDNLPGDILTGDYEFKINGMLVNSKNRGLIIHDVIKGCEVGCRKCQEEKSVEELADRYTKGMIFIYPPKVEQLTKSLQAAYIAGYEAAKC
jgi:hypothetical protein